MDTVQGVKDFPGLDYSPFTLPCHSEMAVTSSMCKHTSGATSPNTLRSGPELGVLNSTVVLTPVKQSGSDEGRLKTGQEFGDSINQKPLGSPAGDEKLPSLESLVAYSLWSWG